MPDQQVFEYAVIRYVPRVEREEFLNIGVIVLCKRTDFLAMKTALRPERLSALEVETDVEVLRSTLHTWDLICQGHPDGGPVSALDAPNRFRWLTAPKSTIIQCSGVHPGLSDDSASVLDNLFAKYVL